MRPNTFTREFAIAVLKRSPTLQISFLCNYHLFGMAMRIGVTEACLPCPIEVVVFAHRRFCEELGIPADKIQSFDGNPAAALDAVEKFCDKEIKEIINPKEWREKFRRREEEN